MAGGADKDLCARIEYVAVGEQEGLSFWPAYESAKHSQPGLHLLFCLPSSTFNNEYNSAGVTLGI